MENIRTTNEIAEMICNCISCDYCKVKEKCDELYGEKKTEGMCVKMWLGWLNGNIKATF